MAHLKVRMHSRGQLQNHYVTIHLTGHSSMSETLVSINGKMVGSIAKPAITCKRLTNVIPEKSVSTKHTHWAWIQMHTFFSNLHFLKNLSLRSIEFWLVKIQ